MSWLHFGQRESCANLLFLLNRHVKTGPGAAPERDMVYMIQHTQPLTHMACAYAHYTPTQNAWLYKHSPYCTYTHQKHPFTCTVCSIPPSPPRIHTLIHSHINTLNPLFIRNYHLPMWGICCQHMSQSHTSQIIPMKMLKMIIIMVKSHSDQIAAAPLTQSIPNQTNAPTGVWS